MVRDSFISIMAIISRAAFPMASSMETAASNQSMDKYSKENSGMIKNLGMVSSSSLEESSIEAIFKMTYSMVTAN